MMPKQQRWTLFFIFASLILLLRAPSFEMPLDPDSGANAFFARHMRRGETLYGKFHPAHHLPGIYYTFELAFRLFGDNPIAPKLFLFPWTLACAWLLFLMGSSLFDRRTGILTAIFFILVSSQIWVTGMSVEMEHFANLPMIAGVFLAIVLLREKRPAWQFIWVGLLDGICILYKILFLSPLLVAGIAILTMAWLERRQGNAWKLMLARLFWMTIGLIIPLAIVLAYFASLGLWERFLLVFKLGFTYVNDTQLMGGADLPRPFGFPLFWMSVNNIALLIFGLIATYRLIRRAFPLKNTDHLTDLALALWLIISMALAGLRGGGFAHYVVPVIPPLAFMGAIEISAAYQRWETTSSKKPAILGTSVFIALVVINFFWANYGIYRDYLTYKLGQISYSDFLYRVVRDGFANQEISNYIKAHTNPDDFIYIWSIYVEGYYYADRTPPIDILWPSYVSATGPPERIFDSRTKYIILDLPERLPRPQWLMDGLAANYKLETVIEGREIYRQLR